MGVEQASLTYRPRLGFAIFQFTGNLGKQSCVLFVEPFSNHMDKISADIYVCVCIVSSTGLLLLYYLCFSGLSGLD